MRKRNKSRILMKLSVIAIIIGSFTLPGCGDLHDKLCPCPDVDFPYYTLDTMSDCYATKFACDTATGADCYTCN
jgi:hypothetical protein